MLFVIIEETQKKHSRNIGFVLTQFTLGLVGSKMKSALHHVPCICCSTIFSFSTIFSELVQNTLNWYNCNCTGLFLSTV